MMIEAMVQIVDNFSVSWGVIWRANNDPLWGTSLQRRLRTRWGLSTRMEGKIRKNLLRKSVTFVRRQHTLLSGLAGVMRSDGDVL